MKHHFLRRARLKARSVAWLLVSWCALSVWAVAIVRSNLSEFSPRYEVTSTPRQSDAAGLAEAKVVNQAPSDVLLVSLLPTGFEPSEITHPAGKFLFGVNNRTALDDLRFQLIDDAGRSVGEKRMVKERTWRKVIEPTPGRYVLRVVGHPSWVCELVITP